MDFGGLAGFDSIVCPNSSSSGTALENGNKQHRNWCGSEFLKQERPINNVEDDFREFKLAKTTATATATTTATTTTTTTSPTTTSSSSSCGVTEGHRHQQQMLSFSSPNSQPAVTFPYYNNHQSSAFSRNTTGYGGSAGVNVNMNMNMIMNGVSGFRGPFTPSQWMELEHQALIYKYITANVPIPSNLLNPIRKAFESVAATGFSAFPGLRSNALGWGAAFHLGFSSSDPEPGRCRRTDGKKWRCSRDAVADQKYCERHMNRGRHRSRKPVEGQPAGTTTTTTTTNATNTTTTTATKTTPMAAASSNSACGVSTSIAHQLNPLQSSINRSVPNKENVDRAAAYQHTTTMLSMMSSPKGGVYEDSSRSEFGLVCSDSLLNPLNCRSLGIIPSNHDSSKPSSQNSFRQFIDAQPDRTHLSISMSSSTTSPANEKLTASPLMLSHELEMGLSVGTVASSHQRQATNWVPISWESSMGGPLGEALHNTTTTTSATATTKPLNFIDPWDNSPRIATSSPTGVLQRGAFGSLSNSSAGSSPRAESSRTTHDGAASLCNGLINSGLMNPYLPAI